MASGMANQELLRGWGLTRTDEILWIQEKLVNKQFELCKIDTKLNTADLLTKLLAVECAEQHLNRIGFEVVSRRSGLAKAGVWCTVSLSGRQLNRLLFPGGVIPDTYLPKWDGTCMSCDTVLLAQAQKGRCKYQIKTLVLGSKNSAINKESNK